MKPEAGAVPATVRYVPAVPTHLATVRNGWEGLMLNSENRTRSKPGDLPDDAVPDYLRVRGPGPFAWARYTLGVRAPGV